MNFHWTEVYEGAIAFAELQHGMDPDVSRRLGLLILEFARTFHRVRGKFVGCVHHTVLDMLEHLPRPPVLYTCETKEDDVLQLVLDIYREGQAVYEISFQLNDKVLRDIEGLNLTILTIRHVLKHSKKWKQV